MQLSLYISIFIVSFVVKLNAFNTKNERKSLSRTESYLLSKLSSERTDIFTAKEVSEILDKSHAESRKIISNLRAKRWIDRIEAGKYLILPLSAGVKPRYTEHEFIIGSKLMTPYYIGYWSALSHYHLTEQIPFSVFIASTKRKSNRTIFGVRYIFVALSEKKFFGYTGVSISGKTVYVSDREKTVADCLDHPEYCGDITEVAKALRSRDLSYRKVVDYAIRMGNATILKRFGYLSEILNLDLDEGLKRKILDNISRGYSVFDPALKSRSGKYNDKWKLLVNREIGEL